MTDLGFFCILTFVGWSESPDDIRKLRGVAQVVERYFREVEAASSSLVTPMEKAWFLPGFFAAHKMNVVPLQFIPYTDYDISNQ